MTAHHCHARGCGRAVAPRLLMCGPHWALVPKPLQRAVWAHYVPGQEQRKDPTTAHLDAADAAIEAVARIERPTPEKVTAPPEEKAAAFSSGAEIAAAHGLTGIAHIPFPPPVLPDPSRLTPDLVRRLREWRETYADLARGTPTE